MISIDSTVGHVAVEHFVIEVGSEPVKLNFVQQIDDLMLSVPGGDILIAFDSIEEWSDNRCMLVREGDKLKEINNVRCTWLLLKSADPTKTLKVYCTVQRN